MSLSLPLIAFTMTFQTYQDIGHHITRIDSAMIREGLAACYLLQGQDEFALIETGTHNTIPSILKLLSSRHIDVAQVKYVIPTHVHLDHAGGVGGLMQALPNATLLVHPKGARHMIAPEKLKAGATAVYGPDKFKQIYGDIIPVDAARVQPMEDADRISVGDRTLVFYDTPGHARHHFCVHDLQSNGIFTGDTFGIGYPELATVNGPFMFPTTTPVQFDPDALKISIKKLLSLQPNAMYLTHYGMVSQPQNLGPALLEQIDDYIVLAKEVSKNNRDGALEPALITRLTDYTMRRARQHGCQQSDAVLQNILQMDMQLNAQGLVVWMQ
jgi:glyoxylase-like metal-dependent hydrolase (beta-lactamase superfamily II)